jgi:hypothetical protein
MEDEKAGKKGCYFFLFLFLRYRFLFRFLRSLSLSLSHMLSLSLISLFIFLCNLIQSQFFSSFVSCTLSFSSVNVADESTEHATLRGAFATANKTSINSTDR